MPDSLSSTGLTTATQAELVTEFTDGMESIYGADIILTPDSPDGQMMMIYIQDSLDVRDLLTQIFNGFDPDQAVGSVLDQRVAINGIQRKGGTYTLTEVYLTISGNVTLYGLDQSVQPVYTVADSAGNQWELLTTNVNPTTGNYLFQAANPGAVLTVPNTITVPVTVVLGVMSINNPATYVTLGVNEESDAELKIRRQKSVSLPSQGYLAGLYAALQAVDGVDYVYIEENTGSTPNGDLVPGHSIWVIVSGTGSAEEIAAAIYNERSAGCGMYGSQSYGVIQADGSTFLIYWDTVVIVDPFVKFTAASLSFLEGSATPFPPNIADITSNLVTAFTPSVYGSLNANELATIVQEIDPNTLVSSAGFCLTNNGTFTSTLTPGAKNKQFQIEASCVIVLPMIMAAPSGVVGIGYVFNVSTGVVTNTTLTWPHTGGNFTFLGLGGYGTLTYSISTSTGGSINSSTGVYSPGSAGTDTVTVTDSLSNSAYCTVTKT